MLIVDLGLACWQWVTRSGVLGESSKPSTHMANTALLEGSLLTPVDALGFLLTLCSHGTLTLSSFLSCPAW